MTAAASAARPSLAPAPIEATGVAGHRWPFGVGPRGFLLLAAGLVWVVPAWIDRRVLLAMIVWDLVVVAALVMDARRLPAPGQLRVRRTCGGPLGLETPERVTLEVTNHGAVPIEAVVVDYVAPTLRADLAEGQASIAAAGGEARVEYDVMPRERGDQAMGVALVRYRSPWALATRWATFTLTQTVRVYPNLRDAQRHALFLVRSRQTALEKRRARERGAGRDFESLREYQDGDELRDICWTASARRAKLVTKRYQPERSQAVWILVDAGRLLRARVEHEIATAVPGLAVVAEARAMRGSPVGASTRSRGSANASTSPSPAAFRGGAPSLPDRGASLSKLDFGVNSALALAQVALASGDRVGLLAYGRRPQQRVAPSRGAAHLRTLVEALAAVRAEAVEADHTAAASVVLSLQRQRALIVWITEVAETAGLPEVIESSQRMVPRHLVLLAVTRQPELSALAAARPATDADMYRVMAAQHTLERREGLLHGLRQRGVLTMELTPGELSAALVDRYLSIKARNAL